MAACPSRGFGTDRRRGRRARGTGTGKQAGRAQGARVGLIERIRLAAGIGAPVAFITSWAVAGSLRAGYNPVHDAISRLAELGAPNRWLVTTGMVAFGIGLLALAPGIRARVLPVVIVIGLTSFGVAAFPCSPGCPGSSAEFTDLMHSGMAAIHYVALVALPVLAWPSRWSFIAAAVAGTALALHVFGPGPNGLMQRIGLTTLDVWLISAVVVARDEIYES